MLSIAAFCAFLEPKHLRLKPTNDDLKGSSSFWHWEVPGKSFLQLLVVITQLRIGLEPPGHEDSEFVIIDSLQCLSMKRRLKRPCTPFFTAWGGGTLWDTFATLEEFIENYIFPYLSWLKYVLQSQIFFMYTLKIKKRTQIVTFEKIPKEGIILTKYLRISCF
jgi:hypothetical protein